MCSHKIIPGSTNHDLIQLVKPKSGIQESKHMQAVSTKTKL